jgi:hypothetical protein
LEKSMYGTRDAAQNWEEEYTEFLVGVGFQRGAGTPCAFYHKGKNVRVVIHGDDLTILGKEGELDWFRAEIAKKFEIKFRGRIGPEEHDQKSMRILNRVVEWTEEGIQIEADQRHAEIIIESMGGRENTNPVVTPRVKSEEVEGEEEELGKNEATKYRAVVARAIYLMQDRTDIQFATKELSRRMSNPRIGDWKKLKRLARYLIGRERVVNLYRWQSCKYGEEGNEQEIEAWTDTDYAGCRETRKSTNGGIIRLGKHVIKGWSNTQSVIALSSGEAEYYGLVRGASLGLGVRAILGDLGIKSRVVINTDASAAKGIASRRGLGKVRHIEVNQLWVQDKVATKEIVIKKVGGDVNIADALTKALERQGIEWHMRNTSQRIVSGRHELMPEEDLG